jgi:putative toxin-antitoxin system antitoxin component (TIGR02293 family)
MSDVTEKQRLRKKFRIVRATAAKIRRSRIPSKHGSVVAYYVYGATDKIHAQDFTPSKIINVLQDGLPIEELTSLQTGLAVPTESLAPMLGISKATLHRLKGAGKRLGPAESDRVVRFARLLGKAIKVFGGEEDARQWLASPQFGLGNAVPLDYAKTEIGAREVENLLGRIEYGVYS